MARVSASLGILLRFPANRSRTFSWRKLYTSPAGFGEAYRDCLLRRTRAMLAFPDMMDLFANKFSSLSGRRFPFSCVFSGPLYSFLIWHTPPPDHLADFQNQLSSKSTINRVSDSHNPLFNVGRPKGFT